MPGCATQSVQSGGQSQEFALFLPLISETVEGIAAAPDLRSGRKYAPVLEHQQQQAMQHPQPLVKRV